MFRVAPAVFLSCLLLITSAHAQKAEVTISLNETFFDALLDSVFQNFDPLEFSIAGSAVDRGDAERPAFSTLHSPFSVSSVSQPFRGRSASCKETVRILKEMNGVRTAVRFRDGKIYVPLAFSGNYAPPLLGCLELAGWAGANIDLEIDRDGQRLVGRARILNVNLNGTGGIGGTVIAKLIQRSIDKKLNPIEIIRLDNLSFGLPVRNSGTLRMKALSARTEVVGGTLNIHVMYEFLKG